MGPGPHLPIPASCALGLWVALDGQPRAPRPRPIWQVAGIRRSPRLQSAPCSRDGDAAPRPAPALSATQGGTPTSMPLRLSTGLPRSAPAPAPADSPPSGRRPPRPTPTAPFLPPHPGARGRCRLLYTASEGPPGQACGSAAAPGDGRDPPRRVRHPPRPFPNGQGFSGRPAKADEQVHLIQVCKITFPR